MPRRYRRKAVSKRLLEAAYSLIFHAEPPSHVGKEKHEEFFKFKDRVLDGLWSAIQAQAPGAFCNFGGRPIHKWTHFEAAVALVEGRLPLPEYLQTPPWLLFWYNGLYELPYEKRIEKLSEMTGRKPEALKRAISRARKNPKRIPAEDHELIEHYWKQIRGEAPR
jgi:hypothetical protein